MNIIPLDWDTINFGFKVGLYETKELTQWSFHELKVEAKERGFRLVYINCLNKLDDSSSFYDKKIIFTKERSNIQGDKNKNIISYKDKHHIEPEIYNLTIKSGEYSRYNLDKNFPSESFHLLYRKWIENSIFTDYATDVLIYKMKETPIGLLTYKNNETNSTIGLISVNSNFQNQGIGSILINHYQSILDNHIRTLTVSTQGINKNAIAFYKKNGYTIKSYSYIYHLWI